VQAEWQVSRQGVGGTVLRVSNRVVDLIDAVAAQTSAAEVGRSFFNALRPFGVRALWSRAGQTAEPEEAHTFSRISPSGWESLYTDRRIGDANFVARVSRRRGAPFIWSQVELVSPAELAVFNVLSDFQISDGLAVPAHGDNGYVGVTSMGFERLHEIAPADLSAITFTAMVLQNHMRSLAPAAVRAGPRLSPRERDCIGLIAEGKSDWEIGEILGVAETTVITHVQSARRKLGARTRAHAVALCLLSGLI
jgi:DNA-binding CsgD family transcriptional regulator